MQYNLKKEFKNNPTTKLQWHGEDTKVRLEGKGEKVEVKTGDVIEVTYTDARKLLKYSRLWTKEGDVPSDPNWKGEKPVVQAPEEIQTTVDDTNTQPDTQTSLEGQNETNLTLKNVDEMTKEEVMDELVNLGTSYNDQAPEADLKQLLMEARAQ